MNRTTLNALYLDAVKRTGVTAGELTGPLQESELQNAFYKGRYLSRPLFLGHAEREQLYTDLDNLRSALVSLPDRLFGGDLPAFARAVGMTEVQVAAIARSQSADVTRQARADLYVDREGFRLLELNMGSSLGGMDNADICRALLKHPVLADFAQVHRLDSIDTLREEVNDILVESGFEPGSAPFVAATDWPTSYKSMAPYMALYTGRLREMGLDAHPCHIGQLEVRDGGVWLGDRRVDIIDRMFMIEDLLESREAPALMTPVLDAAARGEVKIFTPIDSGLYSSKGALAMLSDEDNRSLFDPGELVSLDRILPWTRIMRPGPVTLEDGRRVDLLGYALSHQDDLALKPTGLHGGQGILLGWREDVTPSIWEEQVRAAMEEPYVIQRRIRPVPELFPVDGSAPVPWIVTWGVFTVANGYGGVVARATTVESNIEVVNLDRGAHVGCCLHVRAASE